MPGDIFSSYSGDNGGESVSELPTASGARKVRHMTRSEALREGAVIMHESKVMEILNKKIIDWEPANEVRSLRYGSHILGAMASLCGAVFTAHFRFRMNLRSQARLASFAPTIFIPGVLTDIVQQNHMIDRLITRSECPLCWELRAISTQVLTGYALPFVLSVCASSAVNKMVRSYPLPPFTDWKALIGVYQKLSRPLRNSALLLLAMSVANTSILVYRQGKAAARVHEKLAESDVFIS